jgi:AAA family ATP:ADP antiporter
MQLSRTEKFLQVFTEVRPGEGSTALLMFANVFLILCAYYFIKPLREGWIAVSDISGLSKMEVKAYSSFAQSIFLLFIVGWYARLSSRLDRSTLITRATLFCISNMVIFWFFQPGFFFEQLPVSGIIFYLWVGMFGVFVVAQFWTFCADVYTMLIVATIPLFISIWLTRIVDSRQRSIKKPADDPPEEAPEEPAEESAGFLMSGAKLIFLSRFMLAAILVTLLTNWVNTNGENLLFQVIQNTLTEQASEQGMTDPEAILAFTRDETTAFYGNFYFWVNIVALLLQSLVASRLLKYGGFAAILLILPVIAMVSYTVMALLPVLAIVKMMKIAENATDYSINNTSRHVLWLPISSELKFRAKPAIDTLYVRIGDGLAALTVLVGVQLLALSTQQFFIFNVALVVLWLICGIMLGEALLQVE